MAHQRAVVTTAGGSIAGASLTGSYQTLISSVPGRGVLLAVGNTCNADVVLSLNGGTTNWMVIPAGVSFTFNLGAVGVEYSGTISAKHNGAAPASGTLSVGVIRSE